MSKLRSPVSGPLLIAIIILLAGCSQKTSEAPALSPDAARHVAGGLTKPAQPVNVMTAPQLL